MAGFRDFDVKIHAGKEPCPLFIQVCISVQPIAQELRMIHFERRRSDKREGMQIWRKRRVSARRVIGNAESSVIVGKAVSVNVAQRRDTNGMAVYAATAKR